MFKIDLIVRIPVLRSRSICARYRPLHYNAIDPAVVNDVSGTPWLSLGSFFAGIRMFQFAWPSGKLVPGQGEPLALADRFVPPNAIEASFIQPHEEVVLPLRVVRLLLPWHGEHLQDRRRSFGHGQW